MKTFTSPFNTAKNKTAHAPVNLLRIDWPAINGNPAKTIRLCDRGSSYSAAGQTWIGVVSDWGDLSRNIDETMLATNSDADLRLSIVNTPIDWGDGTPKSFSELSLLYPPEAAVTAKIYQWFAGESLGSGDLVELFTAHVNPVEYDEETAVLDLVAISSAFGDRVIGNIVSLDDYPNAPASAIGKPKPIVIGAVDGAPGILVRIAPETELTQSVLPGGSVIAVKDTAKFPANGQIEIDNDVISYSGKTGTSFTGCVSEGDALFSSGIAQAHFSGAKAVLSISDYRYLFSDPAYPIKSISNIKVAGQPAHPSDFSIDLALGEARFNWRPKILKSTSTEFIRVDFDAIAPGNTAVGASNAIDPNAVTSNATINQINSSLRLKNTKTIANRGEITKAYLAVEHYEEEKLPNDSLQVSIPSIGVLGTLAKPNANDRITVGGQTNIGHNHLETIGGIVDISHTQGNNLSATTNIGHGHTENINASLNDPTHYHTINTDGERSETQATITPIGAFNAFNAMISKILAFPSYSGTTVKAEYLIDLRITDWKTSLSYYIPTDFGIVRMNGVPIARLNYKSASQMEIEILGTLLTGLGAQPDIVTIDAVSSFTSLSVTVLSFTRRLVFAGSATSAPITTGVAVSKTGSVNNLANTSTAASMTGGVDPVPTGTEKPLGRSGTIDPVASSPALTNVTQEKASRAVIEYFDITAHVTSWNWFANQEAHITYIGASDGRSSYIVHVGFEVEYGVPQYEATDDITADVEGVKDISGAITGTAGALIERPDHVFKWSLFTSIIGLTAGDIDTASFDAAGSAFSAAFSGGYKLAGIIDGQKSFKDLWTAWEKESRSYLYWSNTGKAKLLYRILNDVGGVSSAKSIAPSMIRADATTGKSSIKARRTLAANLVNAIDLKYSKDWLAGNHIDVLSVRNINSLGIYGRKQNPDLFNFDWTRSAGQAVDIATFYLKEFSTPMTIIEMEVFLDNLEIEKGDIIDITHSFDNMAGRKALVLEANHHLGSGTAGKMDSMTLLARLFVVDFLAATFDDAITAQDSLQPFTMSVILDDAVSAVDAILTELVFVFSDSVSATEDLAAAIAMPLADVVSATDEISHSDISLALTDSIQAVENVLIPGSGYGLDLYGTGPYGGMTSISDLYLTQADSIEALTALGFAFSMTLADSVAANDNDDLKLTFNDAVTAIDSTLYANDGYGTQWYATAGYGGTTLVA